MDLFHDCHDFQIFKLHQLALVEARSHALDGQWADADARLADAVSVDQRFLPSCRNSMSCLVSSSMLATGLSTTALVLRAQAPGQAEFGRKRLVAMANNRESDEPFDPPLSA